MTKDVLERIASIFPIIPEDVKLDILAEENEYGGPCDCLKREGKVFIARENRDSSSFINYVEGFLAFAHKEGVPCIVESENQNGVWIV